MRKIKTEVLTIPQANEELGVDMDIGFWEALVRLIAYPELTFDSGSRTIRFPNYVPFRQLAGEWIEGIEQGIHDIRPISIKDVCTEVVEYMTLPIVTGCSNVGARGGVTDA